jgi:hypothetical protein
MKLRLITLLIAVVLASLMAAAVHIYGAHSAPGIRLAVVNLPGLAVALWASYLVGENLVFYTVCALANWAFYFYLVKGAALLKRRISN